MKLKKLLLLAIVAISTTTYSQFNYGEALQKSILFYEAQQSGPIPDWNRLNWRGDSAMNDGSDVGLDLTGGWYDAGDHVKFGFPMAYSTTVLSWGAIEYKDAYENSGQMVHLKNSLRFVCDYFIKAHTGPNEFYGQLGAGGPDHAWWGSAEVMRMDRPAFKIDAANPGSDLAGETAAALAAASMVFADSDPAYSAELLSHAEQLYSFADTYRGKYSDAITDAVAFYNSWSGYQDELVWGAIWLYKATGDESYLTKARSEYQFLGNEGQSDLKAYKWGLAWDDKSYGCYVLMSDITGEAQYKADAERHLDYWTTGFEGDRIPYSPGGQAHLTTWGSLRHTANTSFLAFIYSDKVATAKANTYHNFAVSQLNYILGDNPNGRSYVMGFGNNPPLNAHHRTAHGTWTNNLTGEPENNRHILYGALVGGPGTPDDQYEDVRTDYIANEVACDYNACFTGALARMYSEFGGTPLLNFPTPEIPVDEFLSDAKFNSNNDFGVTVSVFARNHTAWPARATTNLSYRYYFDISEGVAAGFSISDYDITLPYSEGNGQLAVKPAGGTVYYAEVSFPGEDVHPGGESESRREAQINIKVSSGMPWDISNDFSAQGLNSTTRINSQYIPIFDGADLVFGQTPDGVLASFTASPEEGTAPLTVDFDPSDSFSPNGGLTYAWDFGNGETATVAAPTITFDEIDNYDVVLTVTDSEGNSASASKEIVVSDGNIAPIAIFEATPASGIAPLTVSFDASDSSDENGDDLTYSWDFGDGNTGTGETVSHEYTEIDEYVVVLTVSDGSKEDTASETIIVTDGSPVAVITSSAASGVAPLAVNFSGSDSIDPTGEGLTYAWDFGNETTANTAEASVIYNEVGTYTVSLTVTNTAGDSNSETTTITVTDGSQSCAFDTPTDNPLPTINNAYNYSYVLGNGGPSLDNVTTFTINWNLENNGLYQLSFNTSDGNPTWYIDLRSGATESFNSAQPEITFSNSGFPGLDGTYNATVDGDNFVLVSQTGGFTLYFSKSDEAPECGDIVGPENTPPVAMLSASPDAGTEPLEVTFDASDSSDADGDTLTYAIDYGDGTSGTGAISTHTYAAGEFTAVLTVSDGKGGTDSASVTIVVDEDGVIVDPGDCTFGTPLDDALSTINTYFEYVYVLGTGGPNMDSVNKFTINWDLQNSGLYQFSFNLDNSPWYSNFSSATQNFNQSNPSITLTGTGIAGLDGSYFAAIDNGNFVLVADTYAIYFSNSATAPACDDDDTDSDVVDGGTITGGPFEFVVGDGNPDYVSGITLTGNVGANSQWVITDDANNILGLPTNPEDVDFDVAPAGTCLIWHLSFADGLTGAVEGNNVSDLVGDFDLSNSITVIRNEDDIDNGDGDGGSSDNEYIDRFIEMRNEIYDPANGYFSADGSPHHSIETLIVEAPDYGHESTSELYSYWMWLEAMHGRITGDWQPLSEVWEKTEQFIIPSLADQPTNAAYSPSSPAAYAPEFPEPTGYPAPLDFTAPVGVDPVSGDLSATYGPEVYQMHWLLDNDNFYGYGNRGDGVSTPSYINTFQRGEQESVYETIPHPSWESFDYGGEDGFLPLFTLDANYSQQWRYTSATDADARAVQAMYWALEWTKEQGTSSSTLDLDKASKMGDYLRLGMFDKYFKPMGVQSETTGAGTGYDSAHYLMSWYISWGGSADTSSPWAFRISSSHCHFGYQNPVAAYALTQVDEMLPMSQNGTRDWGVSLQRQIEFYTWLQSTEGGIAGGATNSWNGDYSTYPAGKSTFYGMAYDDNPVYHDPGSGTWFGWQAWSMERVAEYYYITNDPMAKNLMDKWSTWVESQVQLVGDDDFLMPATLEWSGEPDTWDPDNPGTNAGLSVTVTDFNVDLGIAASTAKALIYYAAATQKYGTLDQGAKNLAQEILDRMWTTYRDDKGCSSVESRGDYTRIFEQEVFVPDGYTGVMGLGETIEEGVSFLDIRSGYLTDPEFPALLDAYESGNDYTTRYHRTWAQMEIALANAEYGFFFGEPEETAAKSNTVTYQMSLSPNPAAHVAKVSLALNSKFDDPSVKKTFVLTNMYGETLDAKTASENAQAEFNVSKLPTGIYLVSAYYGQQRVMVKKLIVD